MSNNTLDDFKIKLLNPAEYCLHCGHRYTALEVDGNEIKTQVQRSKIDPRYFACRTTCRICATGGLN